MKININLDENIIQRLNALSKFKNISVQELIKEFIDKQIVLEEQNNLDKIRQDMDIELLLENFDA